MATVNIGKLNFDAEPFHYQTKNHDKYLISTIKGMTQHKDMTWVCKDQAYDPVNPPIKFEDVEPQFIVYFNNKRKPKDHDQIDRDSAAVGWDLVNRGGFSSGPAFEKAINDTFGIQDIPFDVDQAITPLKAFHLDIEVSLEYDHFRLHHTALSPLVYVLLSLPARITIRAKRLHLCTPGGPAALPESYKIYRLVERKYARSKTNAAFDLRKAEVEKKIRKEKIVILDSEDIISRAERKLEDIKPEAE